jgi:riboflavin kinase / FMN adenylyltransferase
MTTEIWHSLADVPQDGRASVVSLGNFDGVHRGHQAVLARVVDVAHARGDRAVAVTFDPHPLAIHQPERPPTLITGLDDRLERMAVTGLDGILVIHYTLDFAQQTAEEFVRTWLVEGLRASGVVIGHDTTFGKGNLGHAATMRELGESLDFTVEVLDWAGVENGTDRRWSSTWVRELLEAGRIAEAAAILGREHRVRGDVVHGDALGRAIGFPTANLDVYAGMLPATGVYAGWLSVLSGEGSVDGASLMGRRFAAAISLGVNFTVGGTELRVEAHIIDAPVPNAPVSTAPVSTYRAIDIYGAKVALDFVERRRGMKDFGSIDVLKVALGEDVVWCREVLERS